MTKILSGIIILLIYVQKFLEPLPSFINLDIVFRDQLIQMYYSFIYPHFNYGILCWGNAAQIYLKRLQIMQNKILKIMTFAKIHDHVTPLFEQLKIINLDKIYIFNSLKFMRKVKLSLVPFTISQLYTQPSHSHDTRYRSHNFDISSFRSNHGKMAPSRITSYLWSALPDDMKSLPLSSFKKSVLNFLIN